MEECIKHMWIYVSEFGILPDLNLLEVIKTAIAIIRRYYTFGIKESPVYSHQHEKYLVCGASIKIALALVGSNEDPNDIYPVVVFDSKYDEDKMSIEVYILKNFSYRLLNNKGDYLKDFDKYLKEISDSNGLLPYHIKKLKQLYRDSVGTEMDLYTIEMFTKMITPHIKTMCDNILYTQDILGSF